MPFNLIKRPNFRGISKRLDNAENEWLKDLAAFILVEHSKRTSNWRHKPKFDLELFLATRGKNLTVVSTDENWLRVNFGTGLRGPKKQSYIIKPRTPKGVLSFPPKHKPKTTKRSHGRPGTRSGVPVFTKKVTAKGIRPRRFDLGVKREAKKKFYPKWTNVLRRAIIRR